MTPESRTVLRKRSWRDEHLERVCGFANARGGVLEIGKDAAGEVVGVEGVLGLLEEIPNKAQSLLGIVVDVTLKSESGREYIEVAVEPHCNPISYRGRFHYRSESTKRVLDAAALRRLLIERFGRQWDDVPRPGVGLKDLDGRAVDRFCQRAVKCERLPNEVLDESVEGLVESLDLREGPHLKRAAALLFHPSPDRLVHGACVKIGCFRGPEPLFQDVVRGDLFTQVDRTMDLLYTKYSRGLISYDGSTASRPSPYRTRPCGKRWSTPSSTGTMPAGSRPGSGCATTTSRSGTQPAWLRGGAPGDRPGTRLRGFTTRESPTRSSKPE